MRSGCSVYVHILPNTKLYIGVTSQSVVSRWGEHGQGYRKQVLFWRAIQKYGWDNIKHLVLLENLEYEKALLIEQFLISKYKTNDPRYGYNLTSGGEGTVGYKYTAEQLKNHKNWLGKHHSEETKKKLSAINLGKVQSEEQRRAQSIRMKGKPSPRKGKVLSDEQKQRISNGLRGHKNHCVPHSDETKRRISDSCRGRVVSEETREKLRQKALEQWKKQKQLKQLMEE